MQMAISSFEQSMCEGDRLWQLIREAKAGSMEAFERMVILHERLVLRFAQRLLLNREAARDAAQEVFFRLYRHLQSIDERRELVPWLYRATSNVCLDMLRRRKDELPLDVIAEPPGEGENPEHETRRLQEQRLLFEALRELSPRERQVIVLRDIEGYSTSDVAGMLGSSDTTIRTQISTGRVKLRKYLAARMNRGKL